MMRDKERMSIIKNEIPILEFDTDRTAVINPTHENLELRLPKKCVLAFLGEYISEYASNAYEYALTLCLDACLNCKEILIWKNLF